MVARMNYGSVCSGIEAATVAWHPLGWEAAWFSEIEAFPSTVLAHHYPNVPNRGDMTRFKEWPDDPIDVLVGGTPCQSFSVAGLRKGMDDPRGNLAIVFLGVADRFRPRWVVWENVPGVLSSNKGRDFGAFLGGLGELGYGWAYRVLDAQYAGVPQRRRRVFVVGHLGDWRRAAAVLFERGSLSGNPPPSRAAGQGITHDVAPCLTNSGRGVERAGDTRGQDPVVAHALNRHARSGRLDGESETFVSAPLGGGASGTGRMSEEIGDQIIPIQEVGKRTQSGGAGQNGSGIGEPGDNMFTLQSQAQHAVAGTLGQRMRGAIDAVMDTAQVVSPMSVRRLTPRECERLQGFQDGYTQVPYRGKPAADGPRYKALGNSMAVPVMRWIGERISLVDDLTREGR